LSNPSNTEKIMAKYYLQEMPDMNGKGERKVYPRIQINRQITTEQLIERIELRSGVYKSEVVSGILSTLADALVDYLSMGYNVQVKGLGNFSLSLEFTDDKNTEMEGEEDKMNYRHVRVKDINLQSDKELVKQINKEIELERSMSEVNKLAMETFSRDERLRRALKFIDLHGFITLLDYARINNLSRSGASRDLSALCKDSNSGITSSGSAPHKVWVRRKVQE